MARKSRFNYFKAFEQQADIACREADLLIEIIENFTTAEAIQAQLPRAHELEHAGDEINHSIFTAIATDFITPLDRDDIMVIAQALDDIVDSIEDVIQLFYMMDIHFMHKEARELALLIREGCESLRRAIFEFKNFKNTVTLRQSIVDVNTCEEAADQMYMDLLHSLHTVDKDNPLRVLVWSRIFTKMEKCTDACEHVADTLGTVLIKNA